MFLPCISICREILCASRGHVNQVVPRLLQQQAGKQRLDTSKNSLKVKQLQQGEKLQTNQTEKSIIF